MPQRTLQKCILKQEPNFFIALIKIIELVTSWIYFEAHNICIKNGMMQKVGNEWLGTLIPASVGTLDPHMGTLDP